MTHPQPNPELWDLIEEANFENWIYKKRKFKIGDVPHHETLLKLVEELGELAKAENTQAGRDNYLEEIADCLILIMDYAVKKGFTYEQISKEAMDKLNKLFEPEEE